MAIEVLRLMCIEVGGQLARATLADTNVVGFAKARKKEVEEKASPLIVEAIGKDTDPSFCLIKKLPSRSLIGPSSSTSLEWVSHIFAPKWMI